MINNGLKQLSKEKWGFRNHIRSQFSGRITLRTPESLHRGLIEKAQSEGVSLNQHLVYVLSREFKS